VLFDVDMEARRREAELDLFPGARTFIEEFEIHQSAARLAELNHTGLNAKGEPLRYPIRQPNPNKLDKKEPLILVGHGGDGRFMNMSPEELHGYLKDWGVEPGMQVVLAGCSTAAADKAIQVILSLTGKQPVVNEDLAYTGPLQGQAPIGEFTVADEESQLLYKARNERLKKIDFEYALGHAKLLGGLVPAITIDNYKVMFDIVTKFCTLMNMKKPNNAAKNPGKNDLDILDKHWQATLATLFNVNNLQVRMIIGGLNDFQQFLANKNGDNVAGYLKGHAELLRTARDEARKANDDFIEAMKAQLNVQPVDYSVEAAKVGGPLPVALRIKHDLQVIPMFNTKIPGRQETIAEHIASYLPSYQSMVQGGGKG
jgi:hypothetical protein